MDLVIHRPEGLYCPPGDFYIDPWRPVERAVITHAHSDHARAGNRHYLAAAPGAGVLRARLGAVDLQLLPYGEQIGHHGVRLSLHPAGHVLGSAQVRLEYGGDEEQRVTQHRIWLRGGVARRLLPRLPLRSPRAGALRDPAYLSAWTW